MPEIDRWMLHKLAELIRRVRETYDRYEFHTFYQTFHNFCAVDLSAFYLDVIKDRLYCEKADSEARRSAQTVLHRLADAMVRLMAPILAFTAEEVWERLPGDPTGREPSVHLALFPQAEEKHINENLAKRWEGLLGVREVVSKALEVQRQEKGLGSALNAKVKIKLLENFWFPGKPNAAVRFEDFLKEYEQDGDPSTLKTLFIVSDVEIEPYSDASSPSDSATWADIEQHLQVTVEAAEGEKCERCWMVLPSVGRNAAHPTLCGRCAAILE
jgi:isoleucyl-tRNA synthetase